MTRIAFRVAVGLLLAVLLYSVSAAAQPQVDIRLSVAARNRARSTAIRLEVTTQLTVRLEEPPATADGVVRVYVFDDTDVLRAMDDPELDTDVFTFEPPSTGSYSILIVNTTGSPLIARIESGSTRSSGKPTPEFAIQRVLFATNRQPARGTPVVFGNDPSAMSYGYADVSLPRDRQLGMLEAPSIWRLEFREDPNKHVVLRATRTEGEATFFDRFGEHVSRSEKREALVFIHGFNQTFDEALKRTAQIAYDLTFDGPAVTFGWPSQGALTPLSYTRDQRNADLSAKALKDLLLRLKGSSPRITIHVIAHSMGNRVLAEALTQMGSDFGTASGRPLREVAMIAPDIDAELFRQAARQIAGRAERVTLYASSKDSALRAAQRVAGYPRAGEAGPGLLVIPGIDTIDASAVETSLLGLGHSYYADNRTILADLHSLIRGRRPSDRFGLSPVKGPSGSYWLFRPAAR